MAFEQKSTEGFIRGCVGALGMETTYMQEQWQKLEPLWLQSCNPRQQFWLDIGQYIKMIQAKEDEIIISK